MHREIEQEEDKRKVGTLIEKATNSTAQEVDARLLKAIKLSIRYSESEVRLAVQTLMSLLKKKHSQVRYLSLLIIDELFMRSKLFRTLIVEDLDQLLSLSVGFRRNMPLPAPPAIAACLRKKTIEFLEKWNASFGIHYRKLRLGYDYLKYTLRLQFPDIRANAARMQQERREREMRTKEILQKKFDDVLLNLLSVKGEMQSAIDEIEQCLEIVSVKEEPLLFSPLEDEDFDELHSRELLQIRLASLKEEKKVHENMENKVIFDALRELYRLLVKKHLPSIQEWISVTVRVDVTDNRLRDSTLKELITTRNKIQSVKKKCEELVSTLPSTSKREEEQDEDIWEEGKIEASDVGVLGTSKEEDENLAGPSTSEVTNKPHAQSAGDSSGNKELEHSVCGSNMDPLRSKLLVEAPVVKWGPHLDNWSSNDGVLANQRGLDLESHWGRVDEDAVIPAEKIAELSVRATLYKEEQAPVEPCRAPLRSGGLCKRRDLKVCPFHGPIIPRDSDGKPINQDLSTETKMADPGNDLVRKLAEQAVKNVRSRDKEEAEKRMYDRQSLKRAKLAKVREHNEAVLREAAIASTSRSMGMTDSVEMADAERSLSRNKKQALASMLRKKVTAKDRLAERLLNARVTDASIGQLRSDEDVSYREAFPNQW